MINTLCTCIFTLSFILYIVYTKKGTKYNSKTDIFLWLRWKSHCTDRASHPSTHNEGDTAERHEGGHAESDLSFQFAACRLRPRSLDHDRHPMNLLCLKYGTIDIIDIIEITKLKSAIFRDMFGMMSLTTISWTSPNKDVLIRQDLIRFKTGQIDHLPKMLYVRCWIEEVYGYWSKPWHLVNPKIAGKWMFIPLELIIIGFDPPPYNLYSKWDAKMDLWSGMSPVEDLETLRKSWLAGKSPINIKVFKGKSWIYLYIHIIYMTYVYIYIYIVYLYIYISYIYIYISPITIYISYVYIYIWYMWYIYMYDIYIYIYDMYI